LSESCILTKKPIARVNSVGATGLSYIKQLFNDEVRLGRSSSVKGICLIGCLDVLGIAIRIGVHGHAG
jgi:hypothetical protein